MSYQHVYCEVTTCVWYVVVHRRSVSSTRENSSESRLNFNTPAKSAGNKQTVGRERVGLESQDSPMAHRQKQTSLESPTTPLMSKRSPNSNYSGKMCEYLITATFFSVDSQCRLSAYFNVCKMPLHDSLSVCHLATMSPLR